MGVGRRVRSFLNYSAKTHHMSITPSRGAGRRWGSALRATAVGHFYEGKMTVHAWGGRE